MQYVKPLDGVRGLAILLVLCYHAYYNEYGWIGVELFFVLSGYLITRGLVQDAALPLKDFLKRFYMRRVLRILPVYYLYVIVLTIALTCLPALAVLRPPTHKFWLYIYTYTTNYGCLFGSFTLCNHLWSLAIEEQFYLVWPFVMYCIPRRHLPRVLLALLVICPLFRFIIPMVMGLLHMPAEKHAFFLYLLTFTHVDGFAVGALIAVVGAQTIQRPARWLALSFVVLLLVGLVSYWCANNTLDGYFTTFGYSDNLKANYLYVTGYSLLFLTAGFLIVTVQHNGVLARIFSWHPLVFLGKISYGIYIYHIALRTYMKMAHPGLLQTYFGLAIFIVFSTLIAWVSYSYFETPFLALKSRFYAHSAQKLAEKAEPVAVG